MEQPHRSGEKRRIVILGGGFGGAYAAQRLCKEASKDVDVLLIDRNNFILFYPLLVEAGVGMIEGRHVVVPIRSFIPGGDFRMAEVLGADLEQQVVRYQVIGCDTPEFVHFDHLIYALGSVTKMPPVPGLREHGFQLKSLADALEMRDRGIRLLELANTVADRVKRRAILTFVVVGANYSGVEFAGEYLEFLHNARRAYRKIDPDDLKVMLLEHGERILPQTSVGLSRYAHERLSGRGLDIRVKSSATEVGADYAILLDGSRVDTRTVVWTAGIAPNPAINLLGLPTNPHGYIDCERDLRVKGFDNVWAVGDSATVIADNGKPYAPTAQNASRQGPLAARNVLASMRGEPLAPYSYDPLGAFGAFGRHNAVANFKGREFKGFVAWFLYRTTYLFKMPTWNRKMRLGADWFLDFLLPTAPVQLGIHHREPHVAPEAAADKASLR